jgi:hypothetical protein
MFIDVTVCGIQPDATTKPNSIANPNASFLTIVGPPEGGRED